MKIRRPDEPELSISEVKARMQAGERLRSGPARSFGLWKLGRTMVAVLGDELLIENGRDHSDFITIMWVTGQIVEEFEADAPEWLTVYRLTTDEEAKARREHIDRWGVLDLDNQDRQKMLRESK